MDRLTGIEKDHSCFVLNLERQGENTKLLLQIYYASNILWFVCYLYFFCFPRMDRDKYVQVNFNNIEPSNAYNYKKAKEEYTTPYDYLSIMHYGPDFFGKEVNVSKNFWCKGFKCHVVSFRKTYYCAMLLNS